MSVWSLKVKSEKNNLNFNSYHNETFLNIFSFKLNNNNNSFCLFGIVVSMSNYDPRGPGFDSRLYPRNVSGSIGSGMGSTQSHEHNLLAT